MKRLAWLLGLSVMGCNIVGSSPDSDFYTLYAREGRAFDGPALRVELRRPGLPDYLERPEIVRQGEPGRLELSETDRWGASPTKMVSSTLARNLARRLPRSDVFTEAGGVSAEPDVVVEVELQQFELSADGDVQLSAQTALHWAQNVEAVLKRFELQKRPESGSTAAVVSAMSDLLAELSQGLAGLIAAGPPGNEAAAHPDAP